MSVAAPANFRANPGEGDGGGGIRLFGERWVWPWNEEAAGFWDTLGAYGRAAARAAVGTASGAIAGAGAGAGTGAVIGAAVGGISTGGAGAGPGALAGAGAGATRGAIWGGVSGLMRAAMAEDAKEAAIGGAASGAVGGAMGGALRAYGAVRGLGSAAGSVRATAHGYQRLLERGWTLAEYNAMKAGGRILTQADGAKVYILELAPGKFNVLIENETTGKVITAFRHITKKRRSKHWQRTMAGNSEVECLCVFCGEAIRPTGFDPCQLVLITNWTEPREHQLEQVFFCHADCFRRAVPPNVPLGFATVGDKWWQDDAGGR